MKNLKRLTFLCAMSLIFFSFNKTRANSITCTSQNKILPYNFDLPISYISSPSLGFTFIHDINQHSNMNKNLIHKSNNISNSGDYFVCELPGLISSFRTGPVQCQFVEKSTKYPLKMEALFSHSKVMVSPTSSSASVAIGTSIILKWAAIALLLLMIPCGIPTNDVGGDDDDDDDGEDGYSDSDDDDDFEYGSDGDVLVYMYEENNVNPRNNQCRLAFVTNLYFTTTWKDVADLLHDDFILQYNLEPNRYIAGNPRLCCWGYFARYFHYHDPSSETDVGEPIEEFTPDQDWINYVKPIINRINLYRMYYSNGF